MTEDQPPARAIELSVEVPGTPEEVWAAVATGPGISSWYVPTTVEEREGGATTSVFGPGEGMTVPGKVTAADVVTLTSAKTVNGANVAIRVENGTVYVNDSQVIATDIWASNGVIHVVDTVILPN